MCDSFCLPLMRWFNHIWSEITIIIDASIWQLEDYIKKYKERLIKVASNNSDNIRANRTTITRIQKWEEKPLYGCFKWQTGEISWEDLDMAMRGKP